MLDHFLHVSAPALLALRCSALLPRLSLLLPLRVSQISTGPYSFFVPPPPTNVLQCCRDKLLCNKLPQMSQLETHLLFQYRHGVAGFSGQSLTVLARAVVLTCDLGTSSRLNDYWQNQRPWSCRTDVLIFLIAGGQELLSAPRGYPSILAKGPPGQLTAPTWTSFPARWTCLWFPRLSAATENSLPLSGSPD